MSNNQIFRNSANLALRFSPTDKAALEELSRLLGANQTETVRVLVRETLALLKERNVKPIPTAVLKTRDIEPTKKISPSLQRRIERELRAAKSGDLLARIWLQKNASWVLAYSMHGQKRE